MIKPISIFQSILLLILYLSSCQDKPGDDQFTYRADKQAGPRQQKTQNSMNELDTSQPKPDPAKSAQNKAVEPMPGIKNPSSILHKKNGKTILTPLHNSEFTDLPIEVLHRAKNHLFLNKKIKNFALSPNGQQLAVSCYGPLVLIDLQQRKIKLIGPNTSRYKNGVWVQFLDNDTLAYTSFYRNLYFINTQTQKLMFYLNYYKWIRNFNSPLLQTGMLQGKQVYLVFRKNNYSEKKGYVYIANMHQGIMKSMLHLEGSSLKIKTDRAGTHIAFKLLYKNKGLYVWNIKENKKVFTYKRSPQSKSYYSDYVFDYALSPDGKYIAILGFRKISVYDLKSQKLVSRKSKINNTANPIVFESSGQYIIGTYYRSIHKNGRRIKRYWPFLYDWRRNKALFPYRQSAAHRTRITAITTHAGKKILITGDAKGHIRIWSLP